MEVETSRDLTEDIGLQENQNGPKSPQKIAVCCMEPRSEESTAIFAFRNLRLENDAAVIRSINNSVVALGKGSPGDRIRAGWLNLRSTLSPKKFSPEE